MRILVAGASGAIGRLLVPMLLKDGHRVTGTSRSSHGVESLRRSGADAVALDVFDRAKTLDVVRRAAPDVVIHQLTALSAASLVENARVRAEGTRSLVDAALAAGTPRIVAQSIAWAYEAGEDPADEGVPLDRAAPDPRATSVRGVDALESAVGEVKDHVVLRYGLLYGPGTWYSAGGSVEARLRAGELAAGEAVTSFLHVHDAAWAAVQALTWKAGIYNVVDDEPAQARAWAPVLASVLGAPAPLPSPGRAGWERGASNRLARSIGWRSAFPTWRTGFATLAPGDRARP